MRRLFHVTSSSNRASIETYGLDWRLMNSAPGIAGSTRPEEDGIFVCTGEYDAEFFVQYLTNPAAFGNNVMGSYSYLGDENLAALGAFLAASDGPK